MRNRLVVLFATIILLASVGNALAQSDYVLPYPGLMPGHKLYRLEQIIDRLTRFWVFGDLANFKHELALSDKRLVEAKTLFEYQQYLLATQALEASSHHFKLAKDYLNQAGRQGKQIDQKLTILKSAGKKHQEVLKGLKLPAVFKWQPENQAETNLNINQLIQEALKDREV